MYQTIELLLRDKSADVVEEEVVSSHKRVVRHLTVLPVSPTGKKDPTIWPELKTVFKLYSETYEGGELTGTKTRLDEARFARGPLRGGCSRRSVVADHSALAR
jgi:hypothetical protein